MSAPKMLRILVRHKRQLFSDTPIDADSPLPAQKPKLHEPQLSTDASYHLNIRKLVDCCYLAKMQQTSAVAGITHCQVHKHFSSKITGSCRRSSSRSPIMMWGQIWEYINEPQIIK
jgi:hypothetical protein